MVDLIVTEAVDANYETLDTALDNASPNDVIEIQDSWTNADTDACTVADSGITIQCDSTAHHIGRPHGGAETTYRHRSTSGHSFTIGSPGLTIDGLDIQNESTGVSRSGNSFRSMAIPITTETTLFVTDCIVWRVLS